MVLIHSTCDVPALLFLYKNESTRDLKSPRFVSMEVASVDELE